MKRIKKKVSRLKLAVDILCRKIEQGHRVDDIIKLIYIVMLLAYQILRIVITKKP